MLIGVSGKIGAGKDTLAAALMIRQPQLKVMKFATKLKTIAQILNGYPDQYSSIGKQEYLVDWGMSVGTFQQKLGTDAIRLGLDNDAWVKALFVDYTTQACWIVTDVRFPNEADAIRQRGGMLVRINGKRSSVNDSRDIQHISETALDDWNDWDYSFDNSTLSFEQLNGHAVSIYYYAKLMRLHCTNQD